LRTTTDTAPPVPVAGGVTGAVRDVDDTRVVGNGSPFQSTTAPASKLLPVAVRVNGAPPTVAELGAIVVNTGGAGAAIVNGFGALVTPEPLRTMTWTVEPDPVAGGVTGAVRDVDDTRVVLSVAPPKMSFASVSKLLPVAVNVRVAAPTVELVGEIDVNTGGGAAATV